MAAGLTWILLGPGSAAAQFGGPRVPPTLPASPQPVFPALPTLPPTPASPRPDPSGSPVRPPAAGGAPAGLPAPASSPADATVPATTQRLRVAAVEEGPDGLRLRARDEAGRELTFSISRYATLLADDASRLAPAELRADDPVEVTWFPEGSERTIISLRRLR